MANVGAPFFSTWASGSVGKCLTVRACYNDNTFVMAMYKQRSGKRCAVQIHNSRVFGNRASSISKLTKKMGV